MNEKMDKNGIVAILAELGLSKNAAKAVQALLERGVSTASQIAIYSKLPRTTIYGVIREAREQGFVKEEKKHNIIYFRPVSETDMRTRLREIRSEGEKLLPLFKNAETLKGKRTSQSHVVEYWGKTGLKHAYDPILGLKRGERIYAIEGIESIDTKMDMFSQHKLESWHSTIRKKGIVIDSLVNEKAVEKFLTYDTDKLLSHHGRAVALSVIEGTFFSSSADLIIYRDHIVEIDFTKNIAVDIQSESLSQTLKQLFFLAKKHTKKIDLNEEIAKELKKRGVLLT